MPKDSRRALISFCSRPERRRSTRRRSHLLGPAQGVAVQMSVIQGVLHIHNVLEAVEEPQVVLGDLVDLLRREAPAQGLGHHKRRSSVTWTSRSSISSVYRPSSLSSFRARTFSSRERMAFISAPSKELAMAMTSPVAFI